MKKHLYNLLILFTLFHSSCEREFKSPIQLALKKRKLSEVELYRENFFREDKCNYLFFPSPMGTYDSDYYLDDVYKIKEFQFGNYYECDTFQDISLSMIVKGDSIIFYKLKENYRSKHLIYEIHDSITY